MADTKRWAEVSALFDALVELSPREREQRLAALGDAGLAGEVSALLAAAESDCGLLDADASALLPELLNNAEGTPRQIGSYRLLQPLGEGGMGVVWLAERTDGTYEQRVAIKVLKLGMDSHAILRRFLQERRILARLQHAHIVRLLDGGMTAEGRPYYVMEHVDGVALTGYAAQHRLDVNARVALLEKVADAVAFAHAQLVVHRDLKPSNVLVGADGEPRVLDFGIAKLLEESDAQTQTGTGARMMSPAYASPEQILGEAVGTATDVYALGLLLCELLTGSLPHRRSGSAVQLAHDAATTPTRASVLAAQLTAEHARLQYGDATTPARLARGLAGDLDVIIATALQREPARRYPTAAAFARDLRLWREGRPIMARADSGWYRMRRFVRRHRLGVAAAALVVVALVGGLGAALWQADRAQREAQRAEAERVQAQHQLVRSERIKDFVLALFREQDPVSRAKAQARTPAQLINDGIAQVDATLASDPDLQADLLRDLGEIQVNLGDGKLGVATLARALDLQKRHSGAMSLATAQAQAAYADGLYDAGDVKGAAALVNVAMQRLRELGAARSARMAQVQMTAAKIRLIEGKNDDAEHLARAALDTERDLHGPRDIETVDALTMLGKVQHERGQFTDARATVRQAIDIVEAGAGADNTRAAGLHTLLGDALRVMRKYDEAQPAYETALRIERAQLPHGHAITAGTLLRLGDLQRRRGQFDAADASFAEAIGMLAKNPSGHYAQALQFHGDLARAQGRLELAVQRYRAAFEAFRSVTGDSVYTWLTAFKIAGALRELGRLDEADKLASHAAAKLAALTKDDAYTSAYVNDQIGGLRHAQRRYAEAIAARRRALELMQKSYGPDHAEVAQERVELAASLVASGDATNRHEALALVEQTRAALERSDDPSVEAILGVLYLVRGQVRRADGDRVGARADAGQAIARLQAPENVTRLREARALAKALGAKGEAG